MEIDYNINKSADFIFDYLTDMQKFASIHPVIYKIEHKGGNKYLVYEKLRIMFIPWSFTYLVTLEHDFTNKKVTMKTRVKKIVTIDMCFRISENGTNTTIKEKVIFSSVLPVKPFMRSTFRKQHKQLFLNLEKSG